VAVPLAIMDPAIQWTSCIVLAAVFASAGAGKLAEREAFAGVVHNYRLLPEALERPVAMMLPVLELLLAAGLLLGVTRPTAALGAALLLLVFAGAMAINLVRGRRNIDCGCFMTALRQRLSWGLVARNLLLVAVSLLLVQGALATRPLVWFDVVTVAAAVSCLLLIYATLSRLLGTTPAGGA
jgi:uncharacterized membrane protein